MWATSLRLTYPLQLPVSTATAGAVSAGKINCWPVSLEEFPFFLGTGMEPKAFTRSHIPILFETVSRYVIKLPRLGSNLRPSCFSLPERCAQRRAPLGMASGSLCHGDKVPIKQDCEEGKPRLMEARRALGSFGLLRAPKGPSRCCHHMVRHRAERKGLPGP